ncbi:MAG: helix-turn-helix domain-containing protein [Ruminococcaceae bacterium]|nr:helix-turn-helix domain-containing protein [Oscillospiraceae bacterium]
MALLFGREEPGDSSKYKICIINQDMDLFHPFGIIRAEASEYLKGMREMTVFSKNLKRFRMAKNMTQEQAAEALGVSTQTVSRWECNTTLPDVTILPKIASLYCVTIDDLFGRRNTGCAGSIPDSRSAFLLQTYSQMYAPEAGPWNLSVENKYLEYRFRDFFEKNFSIPQNVQLCNIGIGAGEWDTYLTYKLSGGTLTSIDKLEICCRQLEERLSCEGNPNKVNVVCADATTLDFADRFDILTMVGSTAMESCDGMGLFAKACEFVKDGGAVYYQSIDAQENCNTVMHRAFQCGMSLSAFAEDSAYGIRACYYKFEKRK